MVRSRVVALFLLVVAVLCGATLPVALAKEAQKFYWHNEVGRPSS